MANLRPLHLALSLAMALSDASALQSSTAAVQARIDRDHERGEPVVVHVVVALCDNKNQGIVPVSASLGNGQDPRTNLYWGALYGVRTHLTRSGYRLLERSSRPSEGVLERIVLGKTVTRSGKPLEVFVVAEAWDGRLIRQAIQRFLRIAAGRDAEVLSVDTGRSTVRLRAGGGATVAAFVGHNGLMDFDLETIPRAKADVPARASMVLACASKPYFLQALRAGGSHPLLLTTGLMAPEAYTLDAALTTLVEGGDSEAIHESAARAYDAYQKCGLRGARGLFSVE